MPSKKETPTDEPKDADEAEDEEVAEGDPNHNRGLRNAEIWVMKMASLFGLSEPDAQVLGATVAIEAWFAGPEVDFAFGRLRGSCNRLICTNEKCWDTNTPFFKQAVAEPVGVGMMCPMTNTISALEALMELNTSMLVAIQGAHSIGGVIVCSGLGNVAAGPFCPGRCGLPEFDEGNLDGTTFDDTPGKLDNRYYQLLVAEDYSQLPDCEFAANVFPELSKRGFQGQVTKRADPSKECVKGLAYTPENQCDVEHCVEKCMMQPECLEAANTDDADHEAYMKAWAECIKCQVKCSPQHLAKTALQTVQADMPSCVKACVANVGTCSKDCTTSFKKAMKGCKKLKFPAKRDCVKKAKTSKNECRGACGAGKSAGSACMAKCVSEHELGHHLDITSSGARVKGVMGPARWCKRMTPHMECLDPNGGVTINGAWKDCPEDKRMTFPNLGQGRLTVIQNLERFSDFRGLKKRLMVLPSDWSYLASKTHREWFEKYAADNDLFHKNFAYAWKVISEKGWKGKLQKCNPAKCTTTGGTVKCPVTHRPMGEMAEASFEDRQMVGQGPKTPRPTELVFTAEQCDGEIPSGASCEVIGARGVRAKLQCGSTLLHCCYEASCAVEKEIVKEWKAGGQTPSCE